MALKIIKKEDNKLFDRIDAVLEFETKGATPSRNQLTSEIASLLNSKSELVSIQKIEQNYGSNVAVINVRVYSNIEQLKKFEPAHLVKRTKTKESKENKKE